MEDQPVRKHREVHEVPATVGLGTRRHVPLNRARSGAFAPTEPSRKSTHVRIDREQ